MSSKQSLDGKRIVLGMFVFGALVSAGLWVYWELHTRPFRALTDALGEKYPHSSPRVEGGKHGMHKQTARVLRVVMRVDYNPFEHEQRYQIQQAGILEIAARSGMLKSYDQCEIHLFHQPAEQQSRMRSAVVSRSEFPGIKDAIDQHAGAE